MYFYFFKSKFDNSNWAVECNCFGVHLFAIFHLQWVENFYVKNFHMSYHPGAESIMVLPAFTIFFFKQICSHFCPFKVAFTKTFVSSQSRIFLDICAPFGGTNVTPPSLWVHFCLDILNFGLGPQPDSATSIRASDIPIINCFMIESRRQPLKRVIIRSSPF